MWPILCGTTCPPSLFLPELDTADVITKQIDSLCCGMSMLAKASFHSWELGDTPGLDVLQVPAQRAAQNKVWSI